MYDTYTAKVQGCTYITLQLMLLAIDPVAQSLSLSTAVVISFDCFCHCVLQAPIIRCEYNIIVKSMLRLTDATKLTDNRRADSSQPSWLFTAELTLYSWADKMQPSWQISAGRTIDKHCWQIWAELRLCSQVDRSQAKWQDGALTHCKLGCSIRLTYCNLADVLQPKKCLLTSGTRSVRKVV